MELWLVILRLLVDRLAPSWDGSVPLAVRRDGRLQNQPRRKFPSDQAQMPGEPQLDRRGAAGPIAGAWKSLVQGLLRAVATLTRVAAGGKWTAGRLTRTARLSSVTRTAADVAQPAGRAGSP